MGSAESPPLYALLAVLALMATFFSPSRREKAIKDWKRTWKIRAIEAANPR